MKGELRMAGRRFLAKLGIVRDAMREDLLFFALPGGLVWVTALVVTTRDSYGGLWPTIWELLRQPGSFFTLPVHSVVGATLFVIGLTVAIVAQATLWRFYSSFLVVKEDHRLITHGIYRLVRHPIYLGALTAVISIPVYASSLYGLLIMLVLIPLILNRIRIEERMLTEQFGDAYRKYRETTSKLIPFVH